MTGSPLEQASRLVAAGAIDAAVATLVAAGNRGDANALMQHAVWHLIGSPVGRDLPYARQLLRRAVAIGHVDGALMEVALTANGSGGPADWPAACALLETASRGDEVARRQLGLLTAMDLDAEGAPQNVIPGETLSDRPHIVRFRALLSRAECAHIANTANSLLEPSHVVDPRTGRHVEHPIRTSDGAIIGPTREDLVIRAINRRIATISNTAIDQGEALSVLRYQPGQQFRLHHDAITGVANQRIKTVLLYLNDGFVGGETYFPAADMKFAPVAGDALVFVNADATGCPDPRATHAGLPVKHGVKWLATRWIRARAIDPWNSAALTD